MMSAAEGSGLVAPGAKAKGRARPSAEMGCGRARGPEAPAGGTAVTHFLLWGSDTSRCSLGAGAAGAGNRRPAFKLNETVRRFLVKKSNKQVKRVPGRASENEKSNYIDTVPQAF